MKQLDDLRLPEHERQAIEKASEILRTRFAVERLVLFGSKARGDAGEHSDIDLLVLTADSLSWEDQTRILAALYPLQLKYDVIFSPMFVSADEWSTGLYQVLPIRKEVERDGVAA